MVVSHRVQISAHVARVRAAVRVRVRVRLVFGLAVPGRQQIRFNIGVFRLLVGLGLGLGVSVGLGLG